MSSSFKNSYQRHPSSQNLTAEQIVQKLDGDTVRACFHCGKPNFVPADMPEDAIIKCGWGCA